jgi:hypothetical protein
MLFHKQPDYLLIGINTRSKDLGDRPRSAHSRPGGCRMIGGASVFRHLPKFKPSSLMRNVYVRLTLARVTP